MRSRMGGWVENSVATFPRLSGLAMYIGAVAGVMSSAGARLCSISARASASGSPDPSRPAAVASARRSALPGHAELEERRRDRGEDRHSQRTEQSERAVLFVGPEQERQLEHARNRRDRAGDRGGDRRDEDVVIADVRELVREHAAHMLRVHRREHAFGQRDRRVILDIERKLPVSRVGSSISSPKKNSIGNRRSALMFASASSDGEYSPDS